MSAIIHQLLATPVWPLHGLRCVVRFIHYTGTVGHPGYWRLVLFCKAPPPPPCHSLIACKLP